MSLQQCLCACRVLTFGSSSLRAINGSALRWRHGQVRAFADGVWAVRAAASLGEHTEKRSLRPNLRP